MDKLMKDLNAMMNEQMDHHLVRYMVNTINKHKMIECGDKIVVAVSGGADSVALLRALYAIAPKYRLTLVVCHLNHGLRESASRDEAFVKALCERLHVRCETRTIDVQALANDWGMGIEETGRKVRYDFFNYVADSIGNGKIATAHTKNDNVETVMMRFMRGTGIHGLSGIPYTRNNIIRPLLDLSRYNIERYLIELNQDYVQDETNFLDTYTRNRIRLNLIPNIERNYNQNFINTLARNIETYRECDDFVNYYVDAYMQSHVSENHNGIQLDKDALLKEHTIVMKQIIHTVIAKYFDRTLSSQQLTDIVNIINKKGASNTEITNQIELIVGYSHITIRYKTKSQKDMTELKVHVNQNNMICLGDKAIRVSIGEYDNVQNSQNIFYLPANLADKKIRVRTRRDGDVIEVSSKHHKKLKKFFNEHHVDPSQRENAWLLVIDDVVMWVAGIGGKRLQGDEQKGKFVKFEFVDPTLKEFFDNVIDF